MPYIKKYRPANYYERRATGRTEVWDLEKVTWKDMSGKERRKAAITRLCAFSIAAGSIIVSLPNGPVDSWGDSPHAAKHSDQVDQAKVKARALFSKLTIDQKFAVMYLSPAQIKVSGDVGGNGFLGTFGSSRGSDLESNLGQDCLRNSAYDTGASYIDGFFEHGTLSAVASMSVLGNVAQIHPAGSNAPALEFDITPDGALKADAATSQTLNGYGCDTGLQLYQNRNTFSPLGEVTPLN